jgi:trehalose 6-phosphate phosphatase
MSATLSCAALTDCPAERFLAQLPQAPERVLLLDYDGTLAPFSAQRDRAFPYPAVPALLNCIMNTCRTRVVLISGRAAQDIPRLLGLNPHPEIRGSYGIERLQTNGSYLVAPVDDDAHRALSEANIRLQSEGLSHLIETKPGAVAVHWRGLKPSEVATAKIAAYRALSRLAAPQLLLSEFDGGLELRDCTYSKGGVVNTILSEHGPNVPVAYLGDDASDEDAFRALNGRGLTVLVRPMHRFTAAQMWIRPPQDLVMFLCDWIRACGGEP